MNGAPLAQRYRTLNGWEVLRAAQGSLPTYLPHWLTVELTLPASANFQTPVTGTGRAIVEQDAELWILGATVNGVQTAAPVNPQLGSDADETPDHWPATVRVRQEDGGIPLSNGPIRVGGMFGGGFARPYIWPAPWVLQPGATVRVDVTKIWTAAERVWFTFLGFKRMLSEPPPSLPWLLDPRIVNAAGHRGARKLEPFFYGLSFDELTGRAPFQTETRSFVVADRPFLLSHLMAHVDDPNDGTAWTMARPRLNADFAEIAAPAGPGRGLARETVRLSVDLGAERLDDRPYALANLFGTGRNPGRFPFPLLLEPRQSLTAAVTFIDASTGGSMSALRAYLTFGGVRLLDG